MLKAIVTNDDGVHSRSLRALAESLASRGWDVVVAAPLGNWSGYSKSIGRFRGNRVYRFESRGVRFFTGDMPPAALVGTAIDIAGFEPDIVVSGINYGPNLGIYDFFSSGTIGGALEAALRGFKSVSISSACREEETDCLPEAVSISLAVVESAVETLSSSAGLMVVNIPRSPRGFKVARPCRRVPRFSGEIGEEGSLLVEKFDHSRLFSSEHDSCDGRLFSMGYIPVSLYKIDSGWIHPLDPTKDGYLKAVEDILNYKIFPSAGKQF
ncbi:5'-nucleotidase SurE [Aeropyrum pernix]|uniref:5'-nucleotidase SurE n=1 Tax=Aeropyrum pernix TaxID=56636 RepID=A0A401H9L1_AERPX|nr:5'/3'-nucleotidase SurE [Aeropyrum pernix]GBF09080.1 5'-nucleotidase SurE [Aeropyrum pernix]